MSSDAQNKDKQTQPSTPGDQRPNRRTFLRTMAYMTGGAALLSACGAPSNSATSSDSSAATSAAAPSGATEATAASSGAASSNSAITLTHYNWQFGEEGTFEAMQRYFSEYRAEKPNVDVRLEWIASDYGTKLNAALLSSNPPDTFLGGNPDPDLVQNGQIVAVDDLFPPEVRKDYSPAVIDAFTIGGKMYSVPVFIDTIYLYYRKSLLEQAGVQPPKTFPELVAAIQKLNTPKVKGAFLGNDGGSIAIARGAVWGAGTDYIVDNKVAFATPAVADQISQIRGLVKEGAILVDAPTDWYDPSVFISGLAAMQFVGLWAMPKIQETLGDDVGIIPWPGYDANTKGAVWSGPTGFLVNGKGKNVDQAKALAKWLWVDNVKIQQDWNVGYGFHVPPRISTANSTDKLKTGLAAEGVQILNEYGHTFPALYSGKMSTVFGDAVTNILGKDADPLPTLEEAQAQCQELYDALPKFS